MTAIVWTDVTSQPGAPAAWSAVNVTWQGVFLSLANTFIDPNIFDGEDGPATRMARCLYVSHMLTMDTTAGMMSANGTTGPVSKNESDKLRQEYGSLDRAASGMTGPLAQTMYGLALMTLAWPRTRAVVLR